MHALFDFSPLGKEFGNIVAAFWATIRICLASGIVATVLGTLLASMRVSPIPVLRGVGTFYVNTFRNTPLTLVLVFCGLGLSDTLGVHFSNDTGINTFWLSVLGLSGYTAAFVCEVLRSGISTVPLGQAEAARAIGLTFNQSLRLVILPQAFRTIIAPLGSVYSAMIKNSTVVLAASLYFEASGEMKQMFDQYGGTLPIFIGFAAGFMVLTLPTGLFFGWLAKRLAVAR